MARDRHTLSIHCPDCGAKGKAQVEDNDGWSFTNGGNERRVSSVTDGFTIVHTGGSYMNRPIVHCACGGDVDVGY